MNHAELVISYARTHCDRVAVQMDGSALTYGELAASSEALAIGLQQAGIGLGDRIMMFAENSIECLVLYHAVARIGAVFTPVHVSFRVQELAYAISNARPKLIVTTTDQLDVLDMGLNETGHDARIVLLNGTGAPGAGQTRYSDLFSRSGSCVPVDVSPKHPLLISYTSGTTSLPKPVLRSHGAETWSAQSYQKAWGFESGDRLLVAMSLSWVYGLCSLCQSAFAAGATVVLEPKFSPTRTLALIEAGQVTAFAGTMSMYAMMLNILEERPFDTSSLRKAFLGGEPRNEVAVEKIEARLGLRLCEGWAMTESFPVLAVHPTRDRQAPVACLGRVVPGVELRLVDGNGQDVADGEPGEAWVKGPGDFLEYSDEPELTDARRTSSGWVRSGDLLRRGDDGYYIFVTRQSEIIIRGGVNISPVEVESAICAHADIADAVVVGLPDSVLGEIVAALVITRSDKPLDAEAITAFVSERIARFKVPAKLFRVESIPAGTTGKKNRTEARKIATLLEAEAVQVGVHKF
ncbi:acyl--CoA ligase (plasmid) [Paraburkholderia sprentiae WSM5005]|uniref:Acyl--CoA ligase n=1 Tax=Paraburkholderia sprentiae WSM5005 TaxID=754502 RepID=A0A1I9YWB0_9BURK|nr:class I adenylate-forming enzyme family protein [Paraburkholderia sprentiae]APA90515.1 acyl--CoA ligase [Paraburkholderia sprentiae WSM5005]